MNDDNIRAMRQEIRELAVKVAELTLTVRNNERAAIERHVLLIQALSEDGTVDVSFDTKYHTEEQILDLLRPKT